jgi:hypothetical protein
MRLVAKLATVVVVPALVLGLLFSPIADNVSADYTPTRGWTKYTGELDLDGELLVTDAWVIYDAGTYRMWYTRLRLDDSFADIIGKITALNGPAIADAFLNMDLNGLLGLLSNLDAADVWALLDSATTVIGYATSTDGIDWTIENDEVLAGGGSLHNGVGTPCVIYDEDDTTYKMWYTRFETDWNDADDLDAFIALLSGDTDDKKDAIETFLNQTRSVIGYAEFDEDMVMTYQNNQVFPATDGTVLDSVGASCVIQEDATTYKMWYTGIKSEFATPADIANELMADPTNFDINDAIALLDSSASVIGYTESSDGESWGAGSEVLAGSGPIWEGVGDPCVVKANGTYEMWYTRGTTDLATDDFDDLLAAIIALNLSDLWDVLDTSGIEAFLNAYLARNPDDINNLISNTSSVIAYATSDDGAVWTVRAESDLTGSSTNLWSSVSSPCVIGDGTNYTMWFTKGIGTLDVDSLVDLIFGADCTIGRATYPPSGGGGGGGGGAPPGTTYFYDKVDPEGYFLARVVATSTDSLAWLIIPEGTNGQNASGNPLVYVTIVEMDEPPAPPADHSFIGLVYTFGPEGATFEPPITLTIYYDPELIPEEIDEEDLTLAVLDEDTDTWVKLDSVVDTEKHTISVQISGFSTYAILVSYLPATFSILDISITPGQVDINQPVVITATVSNSGTISGTYQVALFINDEVEDVQEITLGGGESTTVSFEVTKSVPGSYTVSIGGLTGSFIVREAEVIKPPVTEPEADIAVHRLWVTPPTPAIGETVTISALVKNQGDGAGSYEVILIIDGKVVESKTVTLAANSETTVTFTYIPETAGIHVVEIDDLNTIFAVLKGAAEEEEKPAALNWWLIGGIIGGCAVITAVAVVFLLRRRFGWLTS